MTEQSDRVAHKLNPQFEFSIGAGPSDYENIPFDVRMTVIERWLALDKPKEFEMDLKIVDAFRKAGNPLSHRGTIRLVNRVLSDGTEIGDNA